MFDLVINGKKTAKLSPIGIECRFKDFCADNKKAYAHVYDINSNVVIEELNPDDIHKKIDEYHSNGILKLIHYKVDGFNWVLVFNHYENEVELRDSLPI